VAKIKLIGATEASCIIRYRDCWTPSNNQRCTVPVCKRRLISAWKLQAHSYTIVQLTWRLCPQNSWCHQ